MEGKEERKRVLCGIATPMMMHMQRRQAHSQLSSSVLIPNDVPSADVPPAAAPAAPPPAAAPPVCSLTLPREKRP